MEGQSISRGSMMTEDLQQDRRLIMKKIQRHRRQHLRNSLKGKGGEKKVDGRGELGNSTQTDAMSYSSDPDSVMSNEFSNGGFEDDDDDALQAAKAAHEEDEELIGGRDGEECLDAMNQALSSPPTSWWAMRKQWQKRTGNLGRSGTARVGMADVVEPDNTTNDVETNVDLPPENVGDVRSTRRLTSLGKPITTDAGVVAHPVMLTDPRSMGYDPTAFRQVASPAGDPNARDGKKKMPTRGPAILVVPRSTIQKRKMQQISYIVAALCVVFLFMFFLEQRKLSNYALVESPMSLSAYLAAEKMGNNNKMEIVELTMESLGLSDSGNKGKATIEDVALQIGLPSDEEGVSQASPQERSFNLGDMAGSSLRHGSDRYLLMRGVILSSGVSPASTFESDSTPQHKALNWMAYEDGLQLSPTDDRTIKKIVQRYILALLYYATNGPSWTEPYGFLSGTDECTWNSEIKGYFVGSGHCNEEGFIRALALWDNNLLGFIPDEIGSLNHLESLSFFDNSMRGPLPRTLENLKSLELLYLHKNQFEGSLEFLCEKNVIKRMKADCGKRGGVECSCCETCGFRSKEELQFHPVSETNL